MDLKDQQLHLARCVRGRSVQPPPAVAPQRIELYRDLALSNLERLLASVFPVACSLMGDAWGELVHVFYRDHPCKTPLFHQIAGEFVQYLHGLRGQPPWLGELVHYEWIELVLEIDDQPIPAHVVAGDLIEGVPVLSPFARVLVYRWPLHRLGPSRLPAISPHQPTTLLVVRDASLVVRFWEVDLLVLRLVERIEQRPGSSGREIAAGLAAELGLPQAHRFTVEVGQALEQLRSSGAVLGTVPG